MAKARRVGPAVLTVLMLLWTAAAYPAWGHYDGWPAYAVLCGLPVLVLWHLVLIATDRPRLDYIAYAVANIGAYLVCGFISLVLITGDSL